jgi:flagellar assembly factor FliW
MTTATARLDVVGGDRVAAVGPDDHEDGGPTPAVLAFEDGIPGFADAHRFVLSDLTDDGTFQLLASVDDPDVTIVVVSPWLFFPDYAPELPDADRRVLAIDDPGDAIVFCSVLVEDDRDELVVNLRAPFVANARTHAARQVLLDDVELPLRAPVPSGS